MWPVTVTYFCYGWALWLYLNWLPLFFKNNYSLDLKNGAVDLEWLRDHSANSWTFDSGKKGGKPLELPRVDVATVQGTTVHYLDPRMRVLADLRVDDIRSTDARIGKAVGVRGTGTLRDTPFRVVAQLLMRRSTDARTSWSRAPGRRTTSST